MSAEDSGPGEAPEAGSPRKSILDRIQEQLAALGVDLEAVCGAGGACDENIKVFGVGLGLKDAVREMAKAPRDQVLMVRVDEKTARTLDEWVETGAVKSRSEAAALFIREGLMLRASELARLRSALADVEAAKARLREKAREVFGDVENEEG